MLGAGQKIGPYTLISKLGKGGFGEVWLAERESKFFNKKLAVKLPHDAQVDFETIKREAVLWEQASGHPNVLPIIDADEYDGQILIVSEYADGGSLGDRLERDGKLPIEKAVEIIIGVLNGLEYLHSKEIIHRDIKPQNILLQGEMPRLADFGISRAMNASTISSVVVGTDAFMSPEAFDGKRSVQTDIWSVGAVLYLLLKGDLPFPQGHPSERMFAIFSKDFEPLPDEIPAKLKDIVRKALAKKPEERYQSAALMRQDLQKALVGISFPQYAPTEILPKKIFSDILSDAQTIEDNQSVVTETPNKLPLDAANQVPPTQPAIGKPFFVRTADENPALVGKTPVIKSEPVFESSQTETHRFIWGAGIAVFFILFVISVAMWKSPDIKTGNSNTNKTSAASNTTTSGNSSNSNTQVEKYVKEGRDYYDQKQYDKAIDSFSKAITLAPANSLAYVGRGDAYYDKKQYDKAIADYTKAIELNPSNSSLYLSRGVAYQDKKKYNEAIENYTKYIELNPIYESSGYFRRGYCYDEIRQYDKAIADYTKAIEMDPNDSSAYNNRGVSYSKKGNYKQAQADWRKALELDPDDKTAKDNLKN